MKTSSVLAAAAVATLLFACAAGAADPSKPARAEVVFDHPENFTDVKDSVSPTEKGREGILEQIRRFIVSEADHYVPEGWRLTMTFTDIDLAGDFEPWLGPRYDDIRIVKPIYPPAFKFAYTVTDASGKVVKRGTEDIRDLGFDLRVSIDRNDPLRYEKDILQDWLRGTFKDLHP
jgi:hypothetical protein